MFDVEVITNEPAYQPRPAALPGFHRFSNGQFVAFIHKEKVLKKIANWAHHCCDREIIGRIVGRPYRDGKGYWCIVTGSLLGKSVGGRTTVKTTASDGDVTCRAMERDYPTEDLMGWFHSHLGGLDEYSSTDKNQSNWRMSFHLGLLAVVRGDKVTIHAFRGPESERLGESYACRIQDVRQPTLPEPPVPIIAIPAPQASRSPTLIDSLVHFAVWPAVFLIGIYMLADAAARRQFSVVIPETNKWTLVADELRQTRGEIRRLGADFQEDLSAIQQQLGEIHETHERNQRSNAEDVNRHLDEASLGDTFYEGPRDDRRD